jgi:hypothetical protein
LVEFLPSKQAVAGSSPVSRSSSLTVSFLALDRPLHKKQAASKSGRDGFFVAQKVFNRHLPHFAGSTCSTYCEHLPLSNKKHLSRTQATPAIKQGQTPAYLSWQAPALPGFSPAALPSASCLGSGSS